MMDIMIDISKWQSEMDFEKAFLAGAKGVIVRAGSINYITGIPYTDYQFERNAKQAPEYFDHIGFYWYWRANQDPIVQARFFSNLIEYKSWTLPPVADVESSNSVDKVSLTSRLKRFLDEVERRTFMKPTIYTRASFWNIATTKPGWALDYKLWVARYKNLAGPWSDGKFKCYPWAYNDDWEYWQFSADGNNRGAEFGGQADDMDLNYKRTPFSDTPPPLPPVGYDINVSDDERTAILSLAEKLNG